jgi:hypothetical protein
MDEANLTGNPDWKLFTSWLDDYEMKDLSPSSYLDFAARLAEDELLASEYKRRYNRHLVPQDCNETCRQHLACSQLWFDPVQSKECKGEPLLNWTSDWLGSFRQVMAGPWLKRTQSIM